MVEIPIGRQSCNKIIIIIVYPFDLEGRWDTTDEFATSFLDL